MANKRGNSTKSGGGTRGAGRSKGGYKSNTAGVPSNMKPTGSGGGGGVLSAPGVGLDSPGPSGPVTVDPKRSTKATVANMKGGSQPGGGGNKRKGTSKLK